MLNCMYLGLSIHVLVASCSVLFSFFGNIFMFKQQTV